MTWFFPPTLTGYAANGSSVHDAIAPGSTGWELALVTNPSSNDTALNNSKLVKKIPRRFCAMNRKKKLKCSVLRFCLFWILLLKKMLVPFEVVCSSSRTRTKKFMVPLPVWCAEKFGHSYMYFDCWESIFYTHVRFTFEFSFFFSFESGSGFVFLCLWSWQWFWKFCNWLPRALRLECHLDNY